MSQACQLRKYGVEATIDFEVYEVDGVDLRTDWTPAQADCEIMKDGGASTMCTNTATDEGSTYSIVLTATEMQAARLVLKVVDSATKVFLDRIVVIETYGNASAQHAMDLDDAVRGGLTALPNAAADANNGLVTGDGSVTFTAGVGNRLAVDVEGVDGTTQRATDLAEIAQYLIANSAEPMTTYVADDSLWAKMLAGDGDISAYDDTTDSQEAIADAVATVQGTVDTIGTAGGAALNQDVGDDNYDGGISGVTSGTTKVGTQTNTFASTSVADGTAHIMTHAAQVVDIVYQFQAGGGTSPIAIEWLGILNPINDTLTFQVWNHVGAAWETLGTRDGQTSTTAFTVKTIVLFARHMGTSVAELGNVYLRLVSSEAYNHITRTDQTYLTYAVTSRTVGYADGAIWVDSGGTAGSVDYVNGTADNPCPYANAKTINTSLSLNRFHVANGNTLTLDAAATNWTVFGDAWTLALGGQSMANAHFSGADVSGIGTGAGTELHDCTVNTVTLATTRMSNCSIIGDLTLSATGNHQFVDCASGVAGAGAPTVDLGNAVGAQTVEFRRWSGGLTLTNIEAGDVVSVDGLSGGTLTLTVEGGTVEVRGCAMKALVVNGTSGTVNVTGYFGVITDSSGGSVTITKTWEMRTTLIGGDYALNTTASGNVGIDWANVENPTTALDLSATDFQLCDTTTDVTNGVTLANGAVTNASLAGNMEIVFETDFATNYNTTRNAWATNAQDFVGTSAADPFNGQVVAASVTGNVGGTINGLTAAALANFFDTDSLDTYAGSVAGSVVKEIADNASATISAGDKADIVDGVWDELQAGHTTAGTFGKFLDAAISGVGGAIGSGSESVTITINVGGSPKAGVSVWISTDAAGTSVVAGTIVTDASGEAAFLLDDGSYYAWKSLGGFNFTNPEALTVSGTTAQAYSGTVASAANEIAWNVDDLKSHLVGEINQEINTDEDAPDRGGRICREAGVFVWNYADWHFRKKSATLTTVADTATADLASDFAEIDQDMLKKRTGSRVQFTMDPQVFQEFKDAIANEADGTAGTGTPRMILIRQDTSASSFTYIADIAPKPSEADTYTYWYVGLDPWSAGTAQDSVAPTWPQTFNDAWRRECLWRWEKAFRADDRFEDSRKDSRDLLEHLKQENDEPTTLSPDGAEDHYRDESVIDPDFPGGGTF